ncbi:MAG: carboxypeptidase regulatory-like domain-containing protein [Bacteroidota bacterium]
MKHSIILLLVFAGFMTQATAGIIMSPDTTDSENIGVQMAQARLKYQNNDYQGALRKYQELHEIAPDDIMLNYRTGETHFQLKNYQEAIPYLEKCVDTEEAEKLKKLHYYLGRSHQKCFHFTDAINHFEIYINNLSGRDAKKDPATTYLAHAKNAKELMDKKADVEIKNMGEAINSKYVDAVPSITADKSVLVFTSRRPDKADDLRDPNTGNYYDDVYISKKQEDGSWSEAKPIPGQINTDDYDANTSISPDGEIIYLYKNIQGETQSGDIYYSEKQSDGSWGKPKPLNENKPEGFFDKIKNSFNILLKGETAINSSYFETSASVTADKNTIYFVSEREKNNYGNADIWVAHKIGKGWSIPRNLGNNINTVDDEISVFIHPDGNTLFYASNGKHSMGGYDILMSKKENGRWSEPVNLGYPVNTPYDEFHFTLSADSKTAYISSNREGGLGQVDIYKVDMSEYFDEMDLEFAGPRLTIVKGSIIDKDQNPISTEITISDADSGETVTRLTSDEDGKYFITLKAGHTYRFEINAEGMEPVKKEIKLPAGEDMESEKSWHFILSPR